MTERRWQAEVRRLAELCGWRVMAHWSERHSPAGWPDLFMVRGSHALAWELKVGRGTTTGAQREWLWALSHAGIHAALVRPDAAPGCEQWAGPRLIGVDAVAAVLTRRLSAEARGLAQAAMGAS